MKWLLVLGAVGAAASAVWACSVALPSWSKSPKSDTALFRIVEGKRVGFIDVTGKVVIPPQFAYDATSRRDDFFNGIARVCPEGKGACFSIDSKGRRLSLPAKYVGDFFDGLAPARSGELSGYMNRQGRMVIPAKFNYAGEFSEGLARVSVSNRWGFVDPQGRFAVAPYLLHAEAFSDGAARVILNGPCNYVGHGSCDGFNPQIFGLEKPKYEWDKSLPRCQYSFIDSRGVLLFSKRFDDVFDFSEGLAGVQEGKRYGFINKAGKYQIPPQFDRIGRFSEGLASACVEKKCGFVDMSGKFLIPPQFDWAGEFSSGAANVSAAGKTWFIDRQGAKLFDRTFRLAEGFRLGLAHVLIGSSQREYIDRSGKTVYAYRDSNLVRD